MSTLAYALTTKEKVKAYLEITDASKDTIIETLIDQVTDFIEGYCGGRRFLESTYTQLFDTKQGMSKLFLNNFLLDQGFEGTVSVRGGTGAWARSGRPIVR